MTPAHRAARAIEQAGVMSLRYKRTEAIAAIIEAEYHEPLCKLRCCP